MIVQPSMLCRLRFDANIQVGEAIEQLLTQRMDSAGVFNKRVLIGTISLAEIAAQDKALPIGKVMEPIKDSIEIPCSLHEAGQLIDKSGHNHLPVFSGNRFIGILTASQLLKNSSVVGDPVTGLPWCGALRSWGAEHLEQGREISVLFLDLPDFKLFNKVQGFGSGDNLLRRVATIITQCLDVDSDILVRFSGDEFAIGTLRNRVTANQLAEDLVHNLNKLLSEAEREAVQPAIGIGGGRRTEIRAGICIAATLDNLIHMAKQRCSPSYS